MFSLFLRKWLAILLSFSSGVIFDSEQVGVTFGHEMLMGIELS